MKKGDSIKVKERQTAFGGQIGTVIRVNGNQVTVLLKHMNDDGDEQATLDLQSLELHPLEI